jgi:hypothetical protein
MSSNIVHEYFKKETDGIKILVKLNPIHWKGTELTIESDGAIEIRELEFDEQIREDLKADKFEPSSAMEFNLYFSGLA